MPIALAVLALFGLIGFAAHASAQSSASQRVGGPMPYKLLIAQIYDWIAKQSFALFAPGVQKSLLDGLREQLAVDKPNVGFESLIARVQHPMDPAVYDQMLFDLPDVAYAIRYGGPMSDDDLAASLNAAAPSPDQVKQNLQSLAAWIKSTGTGFSADQDAKLSSLLAPFTAANQTPPQAFVCSALAQVLTPDQLTSLVAQVPAFSSACHG